MARTNKALKFTEKTAEGAPAARMTTMQALRRSVLSCMLWEDEHYEDGVSVADRIRELALAVPPVDLAALAIQARNQFKLRHVPLWLLVALAKTGSGTPILGDAIPHVIRRVDDMAEFISLYWKANPPTKPKAGQTQKQRDLTAQMKRGLAAAFGNFKEYHFAKYDREGAVKLRDVMFLVHPEPADDERAALYKRIAERKLETPDTWETNLSGGASKKDTFERLIREGKLGYLALLRNLRNMVEAGCDETLVREAIVAQKGGAEMVLPFRYVAAARAAPRFERELDAALIASIGSMPKLPGRTAVVVDVSDSMNEKLSAKSDLTRMDAACALASMFPADAVRMFSFSNSTVEVPARRGMAGVDVLKNSQPHQGTFLFDSIAHLNAHVDYDRVVVVTDEQATGSASSLYGFNRLHGNVKTLPDPKGRGYMINVASAKNGVGYGKWTHIDGFSEAVFAFMHEIETASLV